MSWLAAVAWASEAPPAAEPVPAAFACAVIVPLFFVLVWGLSSFRKPPPVD